jgi:hypothetical protein
MIGWLYFRISSTAAKNVAGISFSGCFLQKPEKFTPDSRDTESHRRRYDTASLLRATRTNGLWMIDLDIGVPAKDTTKGEFWMYYESKDNPWGIRIPYRGTKGD